MLISGGENVYPKEIENVLYQLPQVAECAVFGIPDDKWGEVPAAYMLLKAGATLERGGSDRAMRGRARAPEASAPGEIREPASRRRPIGKIQKNVLKEPYWAGRKKI